jgi:hypothetical protein
MHSPNTARRLALKTFAFTLALGALAACSPDTLKFKSIDITGADYAKGFTLADLEERLLTFRDARREMADGGVAAFEHTILRLLAGERGYVKADAELRTAAAQALDGVDLLPYLTNQTNASPHDVLYWKLAGYCAVRKGRWKLYLEPKNGIARLFDLDSDPAEKTDLAATEPAIFAELKTLFEQWDQSLPPRAWTNISPVFKK